MDFVIFTLPKSGSHMLASALDSHPDINCGGEVFRKRPLYDWLGSGAGIKGGIVNLFKSGIITDKHKVIVLTRDALGVAKSGTSALSTGELHAMDANTTKKQMRISSVSKGTQDRCNRLLVEARKHKDVFQVSYEEMTCNKNIDVIPTEISYKICDFLGVKRAELRPVFKKPALTKYT